MSVYIIAEAGVNHNGSLDMALELVDAAVTVGADAVKFQTFTANGLVRADTPKAEYQKKTSGTVESQQQMLARLELSHAAHRILLDRCAAKGIAFLSSPFDEASLDFLIDELGLRTIKFGSGEITNGPLLLKAAQKGVSVILSTGMSTLTEVEMALACLAFGYLGRHEHDHPAMEAFIRAYATTAGREILNDKVTLLHCTSEYPAPVNEVNLNAIATLRTAFNLPVGYSDHTAGVAIAIAAVALGATVVEKHFTLDQKLLGPDHQASLEPATFCQMVAGIRAVEQALGSGAKVPSPSEWATRGLVRKSIVASRPLTQGEILNHETMTFKRPADGLSPFSYWQLQERRASRDYAEDERIEG